MYIKNGIAYAGEFVSEIKVSDVIPLENKILLLTFNTGEKRLYDASVLLEYPVFQPLSDNKIFKTAKIEHGVVTWLNGNLDIAPETLYQDSVSYYEI